MKLLSLTTVVATLLTSVLARSSVHLVSNNEAVSVENQPEVSLDAFSMFYSHMMDNTAKHPALRLQTGAIQEAQDLIGFLPQSDDLFQKKLNANLVVVVSGVSTPQDILPTHDTSFFVSDDESLDYITLVEKNAGHMMAEDDAVSVTSYKGAETEVRQANTIKSQSASPEQDLIFNFKSEFVDYHIEWFDAEKTADKKFMMDVAAVMEMFNNDQKIPVFDVKIIELNSLQTLAHEYGLESKQYMEAQAILKDLFEKIVIPTFQQTHQRGVSTFILTPELKQNLKRALPSAAAANVCYKTADACNNGTSHCNGNGQCTKVQEDCYTCECKSSAYVGESCQYIDAVSDFQLLFWTSVLLIVITASVLVCVYQSGDIVDGGIIMAQSLPKQD